MKIAVIGYSGSGKSTLAEKMGRAHECEVLHLDRVHWLPGWQERPVQESLQIVGAFMDENESWIIDGNYSRLLYERRMREADMIIFMCFNRFACLLRALSRYRTYKGRTRASMTEGCDERLDAGFVRWILLDGRSGKIRERYRRVQEEYAGKMIVIRSQRELDAFAASLAAACGQ